ncbi:hypothetical protein EFJ92_16420 [Escherichia coli]|uniref:hypothetical protein n=1 Tax=Escherichia coli TaxID=562 RepID=UPI000D047F57|nr:hypothetical protein [Escherichia coli]MCH7184015.1 hypothetical protein [Escherichia coli]MCH7208012.1 hypothetical protein [Escherichia coli]MDT5379960.1 hypothetical protein [Escherichia coli]RZY15255.1 hypothetical protein EXX38_18020 [Escherichia coli]RZY42011.1 hypothetical protein EXX31_17630 [Escherichia coli]
MEIDFSYSPETIERRFEIIGCITISDEHYWVLYDANTWLCALAECQPSLCVGEGAFRHKVLATLEVNTLRYWRVEILSDNKELHLLLLNKCASLRRKA